MLWGILEVWEVFQRRGVQVRTDEQGSGMPGDYLVDHHVLPVEAHGFDPPPVGLFPCRHTYAVLRSPGSGWACFRKGNIIP